MGMLDYKPQLIDSVPNPLVHVHIPRTGGSSLLVVFRQWFGAENIVRFFDWEPGQKYELLWGHFANPHGHGVDDIVPKPARLITFIRDPFDHIVSLYLFHKHTQPKPFNIFHTHYEFETMAEYILGTPTEMMTWYLPRLQYPEGLDTMFFVGSITHYQKCLDALADKLGKPRVTVPKVNVLRNDQVVPEEVREAFRKRNPVSYAIYEHVCNHWETHDTW